MTNCSNPIRAAFAGLALLLFTQPGQAAEQQQGLYISGAAGIGVPADSDLDTSTTGQKADLDAGFAGVAAIGYTYGNLIRSEFELGYRNNDVSSVSGASASGDIGVFSVMGNVYHDIDVKGPVTPFVGAGFGVGFADADGVSPVSGSRISDRDAGFAYQLIAGVDYAVSDRMNLSLSYRFFGIPDLDFRTDAGTSIDSDYRNHTVMVGLRYRFGGPARTTPPAPQPVAAPAPAPAPPPPEPRAQPAPPSAPPPVARNYLVFFDWNSAVLTDQAKAIIASAAENAKTVGKVRIEATGHADRSGSNRYNMGLSQRRSAAVKAALKQHGISDNEIVTFARGETEPLVPTADGVREPQNRRVEIVLK